MVKMAQTLNAEDLLGVMRTFSLALNLVNAAEVHHRLLVIRQHEMQPNRKVGPLPMTEDSMRGTIDTLLESNTPQEIYNQLISQKVEIVLTAHPTEVNRRTQLRKCTYQVAQLLASHYLLILTIML
jgi:phosphoenolpyruvate carboxylase